MTTVIRAKVGFFIVASALIASLVALCVFTLSSYDSRLRNANAREEAKDSTIRTLVDDVESERANSQLLYDQLIALGQTPEGEEPGSVSPGRDGVDGADAPPATPAELVAAVATCFNTGVCAAPPGKDGAPGAPTPPPSAADLQAAVAACFATGSCSAPSGPEGADGTDGSDGPPGADGRGVASFECQPDGTWLITYTDSTTSTVSGPCRIDIITIPEQE